MLDGAAVVALPLLFVALSLTGSIVGGRRIPDTRVGDTGIVGHAAVNAGPPEPSPPTTAVEDAAPAEATGTEQTGQSSSRLQALAESSYLLNPNNNFVGCGSSLILILILAAILYWTLG
jgi:hypothetical protein